jgi:hypothetical protein
MSIEHSVSHGSHRCEEPGIGSDDIQDAAEAKSASRHCRLPVGFAIFEMGVVHASLQVALGEVTLGHLALAADGRDG